MDTFNLEEKILFTPKTLYMEYILIKYNHFLKNKLDDANISQGELTFLFNIYYHESISQRELAELLYVSEAYVTKMLKKLENKKYIERKVDVNNKSKKCLYLTKKGRLLTLDILKLTQEWENNMMKSIEDIDDETFNKILYELAFTTHKI